MGKGLDCTFVSGTALLTNTHTISAFEALHPFAFIDPPLLLLDAEAMSFAATPLTHIEVATRPDVDAAHLIAELPQTGELAHGLGARADAVAVRFAVLPAAAVRAAVFEVEATGKHRRHAAYWC